MRIGINAIRLEGERKGEGRYLTNILREWSSCYTTDEFFLYLRTNYQKDAFLQVKNIKQVILRGPFKISHRPFWEHVLLPWRLWRDGIDVFFSPSYTLPVITLCKTVVVLHDISYDVIPDELSLKARINIKLFSKLSAKRSSHVITVSKFSKREIIRHYNLPSEKITVTYEACDPMFERIEDKIALCKFKKRHNLSDNYILFVGTMYKRRNIISLIKAFKIVMKIVPTAQLVLIGEMPPSQAQLIKLLIQDNNISKRILHLNFVEDVELKFFYNTASVFVYPSSYEGFGLPPLEAMRCGTPVIVGACASLPEVVGEAGVLVNPKDPEEISRKISKILLHRGFQSDLIKKGTKQAAQFSWRKCAEQTYHALKLAYDFF